MHAQTLVIWYRNQFFLKKVKLNVKILGTTFPSLIGTEEEIPLFTPVLKRSIDVVMLEMGYCHLQSTKPDTIG